MPFEKPLPSPIGAGLPLFDMPSFYDPSIFEEPLTNEENLPDGNPSGSDGERPEHRQSGNQPGLEVQPPLFLSMPLLLAPNRLTETDTEEPAEPRMVTVILRSTNDKDRDVRRLKRIYGILRSYPGQDKFSFLVFERGRRFLLDFPNDTTGITTELLRTLITTVGEGNVSVDKIKLQ